ncbi:hypothetical protein F8388_024625 [Cannabis sativa]|uniref:Cytochrome P450 n=1 Tax=Cannabis sativa TaxID=3483 RepID=A0A7J6GBY6_CANSA|nr:hypothetical protein F8388_024625 [Cannabis sativa]
MEVIIIIITITLLLISFFFLKFITRRRNPTLPPGPFALPIIGNLLFIRKSFSQLEPILRNLHANYGPLVSLHLGSRRAVFIADRVLAHQALVQNGAVFADRPPTLPTAKIFNSNQHSISSARYGSTWRLLRRNISSEILHPSRVKCYSRARKWVLDILLKRLELDSQNAAVLAHFQYAMFCLLVLMCFGVNNKIDETKIKEIENVQRRSLLTFSRFNILNVFPRLTKIVFRKRWEELLKLRQEQTQILLPLINSRNKVDDDDDDIVVCYVDTLLGLELGEEMRKLDSDEMVSLCSEFLNAGVILEGLRRHPPAHFVLPHAVSEDVVLGGHLVPKNGSVNFMVAEMGWDPKVWEDPMEFKPERFINGDGSKVEFDVSGNREIKMMPFGVGRRICPAHALAMLHLEYFVANLVWKFEWNKVNDVDDVDLSEVQEFTVVMKNPLHACLTLRKH